MTGAPLEEKIASELCGIARECFTASTHEFTPAEFFKVSSSPASEGHADIKIEFIRPRVATPEINNALDAWPAHFRQALAPLEYPVLPEPTHATPAFSFKQLVRGNTTLLPNAPEAGGASSQPPAHVQICLPKDEATLDAISAIRRRVMLKNIHADYTQVLENSFKPKPPADTEKAKAALIEIFAHFRNDSGEVMPEALALMESIRNQAAAPPTPTPTYGFSEAAAVLEEMADIIKDPARHADLSRRLEDIRSRPQDGLSPQEQVLAATGWIFTKHALREARCYRPEGLEQEALAMIAKAFNDKARAMRKQQRVDCVAPEQWVE